MAYLRNILILSVVLFSFISCGDTENMYCSLSAHYSCTDVRNIPTLYRACTSLGNFCTLTADASYYYFKSPSTPSDVVQRTKDASYKGEILGLGALIIGLPQIAELGASSEKVTCFDLHCSNCYVTYNINKRMELQEGGIAQCKGCNRTYDLNNQGMVATGDAGRSLFRYYCYFNGTTFSISNRWCD